MSEKKPTISLFMARIETIAQFLNDNPYKNYQPANVSNKQTKKT